MGLLDTILKADAAYAADPDGGAESGIYTPVSGIAISPCYAFVTRGVPESDDQSTRGNHSDIVIEIPNNGTDGPATINLGGDTFTIPRKYGGSAEALKVTKILVQGDGFWRLQLR